ncbi:hypothetical protein AB0M87_01190 [Streptomyces sp. NPDC051320]|uniref:hypothetical protein n=1 Tax=Streptomyces sp. NPDC051320 TaxID=3154644 RepID=UPI00341D6B96
MAICATDILLRRNRCDAPALMDETPGSAFWYTAGANRAGALAGIVASATLYAILMRSTDGPRPLDVRA